MKRLQRGGVSVRLNYAVILKPSEKRVREKAEAIRRHRKLMRKRIERDGLIKTPPFGGVFYTDS